MFDRQALAAAVDALGGLTLDGEPLNGSMFLARYDLIPPDNAAERPTFQRDALAALTDAIRNRPWSPETLRPYFDLGQRWIPGREWFTALVGNELPLTESVFVIVAAPLAVESTPAP